MTSEDIKRLRELHAVAEPKMKIYRDGGANIPDLAFYRAAHSALPALLDEIERLQKADYWNKRQIEAEQRACDALVTQLAIAQGRIAT